MEAETGAESPPGEHQQKSDPAFPSAATVHIRRHPFVIPAELEGTIARAQEGINSRFIVIIV